MIVSLRDVSEYWCLMARIAADDTGSINRHFAGRDTAGKMAPASCSCLVKTCIGWIWADERQELGYFGFTGEVENE